MFPSDEETAHLLRESTRLQQADDMDGAIACLTAAKEKMLVSDVSYPIETWCKRARYLRDARRFDEAVAELEWLRDDLPRRAAREHFVDDPTYGGTRAEKQKKANASTVHAKQHIAKELRAVESHRTAPPRPPRPPRPL